MTEIRIEKVMNGYIVRCFGGKDHDSYDDTFVYSDILQVVSFMADQLNEPEFNYKLCEKMGADEL